MRKYRLTYDQDGGRFQFTCWADNEEHAREQLMDAEEGDAPQDHIPYEIIAIEHEETTHD